MSGLRDLSKADIKEIQIATGIKPGTANLRLPSKEEIVNVLLNSAKQRLAEIVGKLSAQEFRKLLDKLQSLF